MNQPQLVKCKRWYCKNTILAVTAQASGPYCDRCTNAKLNLGWFFNIQPVFRFLSLPLLFLGGIGIGTEVAFYIRGGTSNPSFNFLALLVSVLIFAIGGLFRWVSNITGFPKKSSQIKSTTSIAQEGTGHKHKLEGTKSPELLFYDKRDKPVGLNDFKNKILVISAWGGTNFGGAKQKIWENFDDSRIAYLYVYVGQESRLFQESSTPKWGKAGAYLLFDKEQNIKKTLVMSAAQTVLLSTLKGLSDDFQCIVPFI